MRLKDELQAALDAGDWAGVYAFFARAFGWPALAMPAGLDWHALFWLLVVGLLLWQGWLVWRRKRVRRPWRLGAVTVDLGSGQRSRHAAVGGTSELGKTTSVLPLFQLDEAHVVVCADHSQPFAEWWAAYEADPDWLVWTPGGAVVWNPLGGKPRIAAECLTAGFARSEADLGYKRGLACNKLEDLIRADDAEGRSRDMWRYVHKMRWIKGDGDESQACKRWAASFETLLRAADGAIGPDGFDLSACMRQGKHVLFMPDRFLSPESTPMFVGMAAVQVRKAAAETGNFIAIFEEVNQAGLGEEQMAALAQAGRTRGVSCVFIGQNLAKLKEETANNIKIWVGFGQESKREVLAMAEHLWIEPDELRGLQRGVCWIRGPSVGPTRVKLPKLSPKVKRQNVSVRSPVSDVSSERYDASRFPLALPAPKRFEVVEVAAADEDVPAWAEGNETALKAYAVMRYDDGPSLLWHPDRGLYEGSPCLLWPERSLNKGRPVMRVGSQTQTVYRLTYVWGGGEIPTSWEVDHLCAQPRCCLPEHLEAVTSEENRARRDGRRRALLERAA